MSEIFDPPHVLQEKVETKLAAFTKTSAIDLNKNREMVRTRPFKMDLMLNFSDGCGCKFMSIEFPVNFQVATDNINHDKDVVVQKLRNTAIEDESCGQVSVDERETTLAPKKETAIYAIATNVVWYIGPLACSGLSEVNGNILQESMRM